MPARKTPLVVSAPPRRDGLLTIVEVSDGQCVMSTGEILIVRFEKQRALAEWVCQQRLPVSIRTWTGRDGIELIDLHADGERATEPTTDSPQTEVF